MKKFHGVLVGPLDRQADRDQLRIDPAGVRFNSENMVSISDGFDYSKIPVGWGYVKRTVAGMLVVDGEIRDGRTGRLAVNARVIATIRAGDGSETATETELIDIGLVEHHQDPGQPEIVVDD